MSAPEYVDLHLSEDDFDNQQIDDDAGDEELFDCGFIRWEGCSKAGSEECDFECPFSDHLFAQMARIQSRRENQRAKARQD